MNNTSGDFRTERRKLGDIGEELASKFLVKLGFSIKDRNYLRKYGELDIVAKKGSVWHFVEVKTVSCESREGVIHETIDKYRPEDNMHSWKLQRLSRVIQAYMLDKRLFNDDWQFDVVTVSIEKKTGETYIEFLENIVL